MEEEKDTITNGTATDNAGNGVQTPNTSADGKNAESEKTYTQKEVDEMLKGRFTQQQVDDAIKARLAREKKSQQAIPTQPSSNNSSVELDRVRGELSSLQLKMAEYEKEVALAKYNIDEKYQKYVDYEVLHMTGKNKDYAKALEEFFSVEDNKKFLVGQETPKAPMPRPRNTNSMENSTAVDNKLRENFGLAPKK